MTDARLLKVLENIVSCERIGRSISHDTLAGIVSTSFGDIRHSIVQLQVGSNDIYILFIYIIIFSIEVYVFILILRI